MTCDWKDYAGPVLVWRCICPAVVRRTVIMNGRRTDGRPLCFAHASLCRATYDRPKWKARYEVLDA